MTRPRIWLVDDEPMALRSLEALLALDSRVALVGSTTDPRRALAAMRRGEADILIVDIQMPGMTGIELVQSVPADQLPRVIFATAHGEYALDAFDANAVDYVLKPVRAERLARALDRALQSLRDRSASDSLKRVLEALEVPAGVLARQQQREREATMVALPVDAGTVRVRVDRIVRIEADGPRSRVFTESEEYDVKRTLSELERGVEGPRFVRIHRSHIVAVSEIQSLERKRGGTGFVHLQSGKTLPVSRNRLPGVRDQLDSAK